MMLSCDFLDCPEELAELIRRDYKGAALCPFPWCEDELQMELSKIFTRLTIVRRNKERARLTKDVVKMTDVFRPREECEKPRVVLIEGEPGMGKTTYCQKLAYDWSVEDISPEASFPEVNMLLKLKCRDMKTANIEDAIDDQLLPRDVDKKDKENFFRFIRCNQSRILLVLDGLDELPQDVFEKLLPLIRGRVFPNTYLVLTARHEVGMKVRKYCDTLLEIVGYTNEDADCYIEMYFSNHNDPSLAKILIQNLDRKPQLRELTANPLNTALLCLVCEDTCGIFADNRTMLYDELVSCVLRRYFSKKEIPLDNKDPIEVCTDQLNQLGKLALEALLKDQLAFTPGQLSQSTEFLEFGFLSQEASASKRKPKPAYSFTHKSFQEYFAAFYLAHELLTGDSDKAALLAQLSPVDKYWQVWEFLIAMAARKSDEIAVLLVSSLCALFERKIPEGFYKHRRRRDLEDVCSDTLYEWFKDRLWERLTEEELFLAKTIYTIAQCEQPQSELKQYQKEMAATLARCFPLDKIKVTNPYDDTSFACRYIPLLSEYLKGNYQLKYLAWGTELDGLPLETIEHVLQSRHKLTQLHLCNDLHSTSLTPVLQATLGLKYLNLRGARIGDVGAKVLGEALQSNHTLTHLNLRGAQIGDAGAKALGEVLQTNRSLTHLRLPGKNITYIGAEALAKGLLSNNVLVHLDIRGNRIGDQGAVAFSKTLESNRTLSYLNVGVQSDRFLLQPDSTIADVKYECIGDSGIRFIAHALRSNNSLSYLDIRGSTFSDSAAAALGEALQSNCSLTHLYLRGFMGIPVHFGNSAAAAFSKAFQSRGTQLTRLDLHDTSISSSCVITLAEGLQSNRTLERLDLSRNKIEYSGAAALAQALKTNQTLTHLQLRNNTIGDSGSKELVEALECNETLMFLDLYSNRTSWLGVEDIKALNGRLHTDLLWPDVKWTRY